MSVSFKDGERKELKDWTAEDKRDLAQFYEILTEMNQDVREKEGREAILLKLDDINKESGISL